MVVNVIFQQKALLSNSPCSERGGIWVRYATIKPLGIVCWDRQHTMKVPKMAHYEMFCSKLQ